MTFNIKMDNLELRSCNDSLLSKEPHTTAEIVAWKTNNIDGSKYCYAVASWRRGKEGFDLHFVGDRPFAEDVDAIRFMELAKHGQAYLDLMFNEPKEDN